MRRRVLSGLTMCIPANFAGYSIPFLNRANLDMKAGKIKMPGNISVALMPGRALASMRKKEFYLRRSDLLLMIFTGEKEKAMIFLPIVCLRWMPQQERGSGIFKQFITICGTGICPQRPFWLR